MMDIAMPIGSPAPKAFMTTREAARMLCVSVRTVQLWAETGLLSFWKTAGGHRRVLRESVQRLLAERVTPARPPTASNSLAAAAGRPLSVLVVEDEPTLLRLYRIQLSRWALRPEVSTAANGFEALVRLGSIKPDLLITDLGMPEMDGFDMLRALRRLPELDATEIVVVTGLDAAEIAQRGGLPESIAVFSKPVPFVELEAIALRVARGREATAAGQPL